MFAKEVCIFLIRFGVSNFSSGFNTDKSSFLSLSIFSLIASSKSALLIVKLPVLKTPNPGAALAIPKIISALDGSGVFNTRDESCFSVSEIIKPE